MTINNIILKLKKFWWILILGLIIGCGVSFSGVTNSVNYKASVTLGVNYNNPEYLKTQPNENAQNLSKLSEFMVNRFKSQEIQYQIIQKINFDTSKISKKSFYDVASSENGFVSITAELDSIDRSKQFLDAVKESYNKIINIELNQNQISAFQVSPMKEFNESVVMTKSPIQVQILPIILFVLLAILMILFIPSE